MSNGSALFLGKLLLKGKVRCETGLHIGASKEILEIGGLDNPVLRDPLSRYPYIPGTSLKGKLRSFLEKTTGKNFNRSTGNGFRHECTDRECEVCRLFGSTDDKSTQGEGNIPSRLVVRDAFLDEESKNRLEKLDSPLLYTELKFENALDRVTCAASPRQMERVPAGSSFCYEILYTVESIDHVVEDVSNLLGTLIILEDDYLGGSGSRGYGKVRFDGNALVLRPRDYYLGTEEEKLLLDGDLRTIREGLGEVLAGVIEELVRQQESLRQEV
ncbi:MAG: type III-A CRISPR-associated RAMP protein Csm3 [Candidatus Geothermincolales bacterium]